MVDYFSWRWSFSSQRTLPVWLTELLHDSRRFGDVQFGINLHHGIRRQSKARASSRPARPESSWPRSEEAALADPGHQLHRCLHVLLGVHLTGFHLAMAQDGFHHVQPIAA